ncbi:3-dehydroquinate synthase II [Candidatus Bathyarchaeota archaeon]|nr:MAG: 3-dehydroquinate synthase II [Candidatus Bathyarchaeota archaeon]
MREFWIEFENSITNVLKEELLRVSKDLCDVIVLSEADIHLGKSYTNLIASPVDGDIQIIEEEMINQIEMLKRQQKILCLKLLVKDRNDEAKAVKAVESGVDYIIVICPNWKIIPLENLIAKTRKKVKLLAEVANAEEAKIAVETLELGVDGVVLKTDNPKEIEATAKVLKNIVSFSLIKEKNRKMELTTVKILNSKQLSMGLRVCIDTCDIMTEGEGMLIGCQSTGLFLIQAEVEENPHVEPRPFRVNAGPISLYILDSDNKTRYLSELKAGDEVLVVNREGYFRKVVIGRLKIERRPLTLIEAEIDGYRIKTIVQNAETVRFVTKDGSISVNELNQDDKVLAYRQLGGRHFGVLVQEESVIER